MNKNTINNLLKEINEITKNNDLRISKNSYYLNDGSILCCNDRVENARFPYIRKDYTLWAYSSGRILIKNGVFNILSPTYDEPLPTMDFFAGIKREDGSFFPISLLGITKNNFEPYNVKRYTVFKLTYALYITDTDIATFVVRCDMSANDEARFTFYAFNKKHENLDITLTSYFDLYLNNTEHDSMWTVRGKKAKYLKDGSFLFKRNDENPFVILNRNVSGTTVKKSYYTTNSLEFTGGTDRSIYNAKALKEGIFEKQSAGLSIASEILYLNIKNEARVDYVLTITRDINKCEDNYFDKYTVKDIDNDIENSLVDFKERYSHLSIDFSGKENVDLNQTVFNNFIKDVERQVDLCAMGNDYVEDMLGVRDVFQQLEQSMLWDPLKTREKIIRALNFINEDGRAPRQFSIPAREDTMPKMDLRAYIDQGNFILTTIYSYLAFTNDFSILDEECNYLKFFDNNIVEKSDIRDSVLCHIIKITDYLVSNIDEKTNCLHILYGDWNDAIDGLGKTEDKNKKFGTGVSVMATMQLYRNLDEIIKILSKINKYEEKIPLYNKIRNNIEKGIEKYAIVENENKDKRIIHGWGDNLSYKIGSFNDVDNKSRISFAPNAFFAISGLINKMPHMKDIIIRDLLSLDSKYGLKTLIPYFAKGTKGVGRIATILKGTAENECVYVHATLFSVLALFTLGEYEKAFNHFMKVLPITHDNLTLSPFVMSNSYFDNYDEGLDGESAIDWYTGSGTLVIKILVRCILGINADLEGVIIKPSLYIPFKNIKAKLMLKGYHTNFTYKKGKGKERKIYYNNKLISETKDEISGNTFVKIPNEDLQENGEILVSD